MTTTGTMVARTIDELPREAFHRIFVQGLCRKPAFGHLLVARAEDLSNQEKVEIMDTLMPYIPKGEALSDEDLSFIGDPVKVCVIDTI